MTCVRGTFMQELPDPASEADLPKIDLKSVSVTLAPMIIDYEALRATGKVRKSPFVTKGIHVADIELEEGRGWTVTKKGVRKATVQKPKPVSKYLEDRFWTLCRDMGYPVMNGDTFKVAFKREDGSVSSKQIDVFAKDDETVIIAECKTREVRGRKSLQKDLHETAYLQKLIANSVRDHFGSGFSPKILWLYVTQNIIWSEPDLGRAAANNIRVITENELQYFEAYISHLGTAGRYQFLAEFFQGQDIPNLEETKVAAVRGRLGKDTFYSFTIPAGHLLKLAFVNHHALNNPEGRPAYQRMIDKKRLAGIGKFIAEGGYFPTNLLINFVQSCKFELAGKQDGDGSKLQFGHLTLPSKYKSAWVIDGQHRLFGFTNLEDKYLKQPLFVVAFEKLDTLKEADLFITINHKQKSVPSSLLVALQADLQMGSDDPEEALAALASFLIRKISADPASPLYGRFQIPGVPATELQVLTVPEIQKGLRRSQLLGRVVKKARLSGYFSAATDDLTLERARKALNGYFSLLEAASPEAWAAGRTGYILTNPGVRAHIMMLSEALRYLHGLGKIDPLLASPEQIKDKVAEFAAPMFDWLKSAKNDEMEERFARRYGEGGVKEYFYHLCDLLSKDHPTFGPDEYREFRDKSKDERQTHAKLDVEDLTKLISKVVIEKLKEIYGVDELPSGEKKYWELGIADSKIKEDAYKAQQQTKPEKRAPREAYLHLIDFEKIIKQKGNWEHFKPIFNIPKPGVVLKSKEYHLDWLNDFNEIRRVASHSSIYRQLADEDLDHLAWIKAEVYSRCVAAGLSVE